MPYELFLALRYLLAKRKQTFLSLISLISVLGITVGVTALIIALALATGFQEDLRAKILGSNPQITVFAGWGRHLSGHDDVIQEVMQVDHVAAAAPLVLEKGLLVSDLNPRGSAAVVQGIDPSIQNSVTDLVADLERGARSDAATDPEAPPPPLDALRTSRSAADPAGPRLATLFLGHELAMSLGVDIGDRVRLIVPQARLSPFSLQPKSATYRVAGLVQSGFYDYDTTRIYMHLSEAQRLFALDGSVDAVQVRVDSLKLLAEVRQSLQRRLGEGYRVTDLLDQNRSFFSALKLEKLVAFLVIALIILVAALNIVSTLILMVMEKVRDIGTLISMGATSRGVMILFLLQGAIIGLVGTSLGCALGFGVCWVMDSFRLLHLDPDVYFISYVPFEIRPLDFTLTALVSLLISFVATVYPAWRASRLDPVEALRYE
jgi:lipoprotein-releasing system permease protein